MSYQIISPPFSLKFREMKRKELEEYFAWFTSIIPERVGILISTVQTSLGFASWVPDYSPESLKELGKWFSEHVQTRPRTDEEREEIYRNAAEWFRVVEVSNKELTNQTFSIAIDIGMYLSEVFIKNNPDVHWQLNIGRRKDIDYGQPVLAGFGQLFFNPVRMMIVIAYGLADRTYNGGRLYEIYNIWTSMIKK